ncbi:atherin [Triticum dicoccoides]|uniref:atherin n=1 Tax=Triticum dicoccoides TaxID=85692 RepID=UPI00162DBA73|nr:atherin [Triticum dicoccoides]
MARRSVHRRQEFSFAGDSPTPSWRAEAGEGRALPPRPPVVATANPMAPRAGEEDFRWLQASRQGSPESGSGSGTPSPQLWAHREHHHDRLYPASAGSSPSRAQAIAGYRREMLDLVRGLPEAAYELSLRDIVESRPSPLPPPPPPPPAQPYAVATQEQGNGEPKKDVTAAARNGDEAKKQSDGGGKKQGKARKQRTMGRTRSRSMERSVSLDTGLLIKLFLPLSVGRKKKVSPKPAAVAPAKDGRKKTKKKKKKEGKKEDEEEWWKKSEFSEAGSSSRTSSSGSSNSSASRNNGNGGSDPKAPSRSRSRKRIGCYGFFRANKGKNGVIQE